MEEHFTRPFLTHVMSRMRKPSGLACNEKTVADYVQRLRALKKLNMLDRLLQPDALYGAL
jgi:hypothetical protein